MAGTGSAGGSNSATWLTSVFDQVHTAMTDPVTLDVLVTEWRYSRIRKLSAGGGQVTTLAGSGSTGFADGTGTSAVMYHPGSIVYDESTSTYLFCDADNHRVRRVTRSGVVATVAGDGTASTVDGTGTAARLNRPRYMAAAAGSIFYISEWGGCAIRRMSSGVVTTIFSGACSVGSSTFSAPLGIAFRPADQLLYIADSTDCTIKTLTLAGALSVLAGASGTCSYAGGTLSQSRFTYPHGLDWGAKGQLVVTDRNADLIREIWLDTGMVTNLAGSPNVVGSVDGTGSAARFYYPMDARLAAHGGYLLVTDFDTGSIRKIT